LKTVSKKIILVGSFCVGKTSLVSSFVYQKFNSIYQTTLGVRVDKKNVKINDIQFNLLIWDIGGEIDNSRLPKSYFLGAAGILFVIDLSREIDKANILNDIEFLKTILPNIPIICLGNKKDLLDNKELSEKLTSYPIEIDFTTSAKTGENVEESFLALAKKMI